MSTNIVATVLLQHRKGISEDEMVRKAQWIYEEISARGAETMVSTPPSSTSVQAALKYLEGFVERKRNIFEPSVLAKKSSKNILMLSYYRNNLIHVFINEAFIACTILGLTNMGEKVQEIPLESIWKRTSFLANLMSEEFMIRSMIKSYDDFV